MPAETESRAVKLERAVQIGIVVPDLEPIKMRQTFPQVGPLELELIQPLEGENNAYKQFLDETGGGTFIPTEGWS